MKLGYFTLSDNPPGYAETRKDHTQYIHELVEECIYAEQIGLNSVWLPEHHFGLFGILPSASVFLAHVAARTTRLKLGVATVVLPLSHPLRVAEEFALLDVLSNGRVVFSAGRGYDVREYNGFDVDFECSQELFFEGLDVLKKAWSQKSLSHEGKFYRFPECSIVPPPIQEPYPPIYVACFSAPTMRFAARAGHNLLLAPFAAAAMFGSLKEAVSEFKRESEAAGYTGKQVMCSYFANITYDEASTLRTKERLIKYFHGAYPALPSNPDTVPAHLRYWLDLTRRQAHVTAEELEERSIIAGGPEHCLAVLKRCEEAGIEEVIIYFNFGGLSHVETLKSMDRMAEHVLPHFQSAD